MSIKSSNKFRFRQRHVIIFLSFLFLVITPLTTVVWYLNSKAQDQFTSTVAFTVRSEEILSAIDIFSGLGAMGSAGSKDTDVLYEFVRSRAIVQKIDKKLNLRKMFSSTYNIDPWYSFDENGTIEDLVEYWNDMVKIFYDRSTGMIEIRVHAFNSSDAKNLSTEILKESSVKINMLNDVTRADGIKYSKKELEIALERLRIIRSSMTEFRTENKLVSLEAELTLQTGVLSALQAELSSYLIEIDMLSNISSDDDPRKLEYEQRIAVIENRIKQERLKFSVRDQEQSSYSKLLADFESLQVDREYAEQLYLSALAGYDSAIAKSQRQSRYLATYIDPTFAERAEYPEKKLLIFIIFIILLFSWLTFLLLYYAIRDKR